MWPTPGLRPTQRHYIIWARVGQRLAGPSVAGSIPALVDVSSSKTLNPELLPVAVSTVYQSNVSLSTLESAIWIKRIIIIINNYIIDEDVDAGGNRLNQKPTDPSAVMGIWRLFHIVVKNTRENAFQIILHKRTRQL